MYLCRRVRTSAASVFGPRLQGYGQQEGGQGALILVLVEQSDGYAHLGSAAGTGTGVPLAFSDQSGANMAGKKLYKADLRGTNFANADLSNANLFGAFAKDASFKCGLLSSPGMHLHSVLTERMAAALFVEPLHLSNMAACHDNPCAHYG